MKRNSYGQTGKKHYKRALALRMKGATFQEIGEQLGVTKQRAQQILADVKLQRKFVAV